MTVPATETETESKPEAVAAPEIAPEIAVGTAAEPASTTEAKAKTGALADLKTRLGAACLRAAAGLTGKAITLFARIVTSPRAIWSGIEPVPRQRIYFANHSSNGDFVLIWTVLPAMLRAQTRPVAALDYWLTSPLRRFIGRDVFNAVLIDRRTEERQADPVTQMTDALDSGASLILFPEGKRNMEAKPLLPFKSGLYHVARARPEVDLVPVWISNLNQIMPKGEVIPLPLICTLSFGEPLHVRPEESKDAFLARSRDALLTLGGKPETELTAPPPATAAVLPEAAPSLAATAAVTQQLTADQPLAEAPAVPDNRASSAEEAPQP